MSVKLLRKRDGRSCYTNSMFHCDDFLEIIRYCLIDCISNVLKSKSIYKI